jgi:Rnl2 family RNA ligase
MKFYKYPSIENSYNSKTVNYFREQIPGLDEIECIVEEKLHGANFSFHYDSETQEVKAAKRSGFLNEGENFYNSAALVQKVSEKIKSYFAPIFESNSGVNIIIYGELIGGSFPEKVSPYKAIQKGVYYTPDIEFVVFDILSIENDICSFYDPEWVRIVAKFINLPTPKILFQGKFKDCLNFNPEFKSELYKTLRPDLADTDVGENIAEGGVIKPMLQKYILTPNGDRVMLKIKGEKWKEVSRTPREPIIVDNEITKKHLTNLMSYMTENRLNNVLSHEGMELDFKYFKKLCGLFIADIVKDYESNTTEFVLEENEYAEARKLLWREIETFVRQKILSLTGAASQGIIR